MVVKQHVSVKRRVATTVTARQKIERWEPKGPVSELQHGYQENNQHAGKKMDMLSGILQF